MNLFHKDQAAWLKQVEETILEPDLPIIDSHHHLWPDMRGDVYNVDDFAVDTGAGHGIVGTVFMECGTCYRESGPEHERPLGETEYVLSQAARVEDVDAAVPILGMVGHVDLSDSDRLDAALDAHIDLAGDFFKGIRDAGASPREADRDHLFIPGPATADLYDRSSFRAGVRRLGARGLTYDTWQYHYQLPDLVALARACPDTVIVLDHLSTPLGVGPHTGRRAEIFRTWRKDIRTAAECPNICLKLGGMAMPDNGFAWHTADRPPTSDELLDAQGDWYRHALDCFGVDRCMFESNFPVDRLSLSYAIYWNAMKKLTADCSDDEKDAVFAGTARRVYRLPA